MADDQKTLTTTAKSISLTFIDFLGSLMPGLVWLPLLFSIAFYAYSLNPVAATDISKLRDFLIDREKNELQILPAAIYLASALITGYLIKTIAMEFAGFLVRPFLALYFCVFNKKRFKEVVKTGAANNIVSRLKYFREVADLYKFPYPIHHEGTAYVVSINGFIKVHADMDIQSIPMKHPFSYMKRLIKVTLPALWEDVYQLEAEVRMLGSMFLASVLLFAYGLLLSRARDFGMVNVRLLCILFFTAAALGYAFHRRRIEEVNYVYLLSVLTIGNIKHTPKDKEGKAA